MPLTLEREDLPLVVIFLLGTAVAAFNSIVGAVIMAKLAERYSLPRIHMGQAFVALFLGRVGVEALTGLVLAAIVIFQVIDLSMIWILLGGLVLVGFFLVSASVSRLLRITPEQAMLLHLTTLLHMAIIYGAVVVVALVVANFIYPDALAHLGP